MSFDEKFRSRWERVISPAVSRIERDGERMSAYRVDGRTISDSILTEILSGIANSRLVLADVTTIGQLDGKPIRNGNVLYEVGIAHAARIPEEVLLFRSDDDPLPFDVTNVRVNRFDPDADPAAAVELVVDAILNALREVDLRRSLAVSIAVEGLDFFSWWVLAESGNRSKIPHPTNRTFGDVVGNAQRVSAIHRLLDIGALRASFLKIDPATYHAIKNSTDAQLMTYEVTEFGTALFFEGVRRLGIDNPEMAKILESEFQRAGP